ncbi:dipeptidyl aminopeptidase/acylaminoacyl peptidase [Kushneria sinocarnis]|uniref:Dipeptidyl aminopeptidase/acylaminoacyl peptidase n=1 Tax=Kushneria sinocarnis TaxID=595502 RepID=A0A420WXL5_9GAMM|nr:S9 family peptidase [Kushneria sinocarnis]RKR04460.1 dipeptidyl aminopeptidase/acylaminoacyl peptidase [Kushneria sinocarnis]
MRRMIHPVGPVMSADTAAGGAAAGSGEAVPLIERERLFGNPRRAQGRLSPDGRWLAWIAPRDEVLNLWVAPIDAPDQGRALTAEQVRPIRSYFWSPDSRALLYVNDSGGDENFRLFSVDIESGEQRTLTPFEDTRVQIIGVSREIRDRILVGINHRDPRWHDVYSLELASGELTLILENEGYAGFLADEHLELRLAAQPLEDGGEAFFRITEQGIEREPFATIGFEDSANTGPVGFTRDGSTVYWIDSRGRDTAALTAQDWASGELRLLGHSPKADITDILLDPRSDEVQAWAVDYLRTEWTALDDTLAADLAFLDEQLKGDIAITSRTDDDRRWTVVNDPVTAPAETWLYDREQRTLSSLYVSRPELADAPLAGMTPLELSARDGRTLVSYLTLPHGSDADGFHRPAAPLPMVLLVHGGPWARDSYGSNGYHQWLANRGYAVLSVNYRGSTGFSKAFTGAGDGEWAGAMHDDLLDAVDWAISAGVADSDRVAIMGGSYGGYATLVGLTFTPERFACGVDIVGPSNLETLLSTIPPYWEAGKRQMYRRMADPNTQAGAAWLKERSPLTHADRITRPLLIGQGANDPRVRQAESDQIVEAMKHNGIPVTYVLFPDEGHGFARPVNNIAFNAVTEAFLAEALSGRFEPIGEALQPSSITVPHGAEYAPGVRDALHG